jgi:16S rRNA C1402 N4-methylase RsmH
MAAEVVRHVPVMVKNVIQRLAFLKEHPDRKYLMLDCTLGTAGHAKLLLNAYPNLSM